MPINEASAASPVLQQGGTWLFTLRGRCCGQNETIPARTTGMGTGNSDEKTWRTVLWSRDGEGNLPKEQGGPFYLLLSQRKGDVTWLMPASFSMLMYALWITWSCVHPIRFEWIKEYGTKHIPIIIIGKCNSKDHNPLTFPTVIPKRVVLSRYERKVALTFHPYLVSCKTSVV